MKILVISDTHDNLDALKKIHKVVLDESPDLAIHCGDYVSPFTVRKLVEFDIPVYGVWGNNDGDKQTSLKFIEGSKVTIEPQPREIDLWEGSLVIHGWGSPQKTVRLVRSIARGGEYKYIFFGHTHNVMLLILNEKSDAIIDLTQKLVDNKTLTIPQQAKTIVMNPGEAGGWLTNTKTYIIYDSEERKITLGKL